MTCLNVNLACMAMVSLLLLWQWRKTQDLWSCGNVFSASFGFTLLGSQLWSGWSEEAYQLTAATLLLLYSGWIAFLLGMAVTLRRSPPQQHPAGMVPVRSKAGIRVMVTLMVANLVHVVAMLNAMGILAILRGGQFGIIESFAANRIVAASSESPIHLGWYLEVWHNAYVYYVPLALFLYKQRRISKRVLLFVCGYAGVLSVAGFSRVQLLMPLVFGFVTWIVLFRPPGWKVFRIVSVLVGAPLVLFAAMQSTLGHMTASESSDLELVAGYAFSSPLAFQELLNGNYQEANPHHALYSAQGVYYVLGKLSLINPNEYPVGFREWVFVPYPTNVYTFLDCFALDFGTAGIVFGPFLMGMGMAWVYERVNALTTYSMVVLYGFCVYSSLLVNLANMTVTFELLFILGFTFLLRPLLKEKPALKQFRA
jgi:oligosaccharide repeat unit polymerase